MRDSLDQLVELAKEGHTAAFSDIVKLTQQKLLTYVYPMLGSSHDAEDVVQEVYIRAYQHLRKYRRDESFIAWLYTICYRLCMNKLKKRSRRLQLLPKLHDEAVLNVEVGRPDSHEESELSLLDGLSAYDRSVIVLRVIHELSYREISQITGRSETALRKHYERVRKKIQQKCAGSSELSTGNAELVAQDHYEGRRGLAYDQSV